MWPFPTAGKNWDLTAALSDFEQLRQVHAGSLSYTFPEEREQVVAERDIARVGRPLLHRQDEVVQGTATLLPAAFPYKTTQEFIFSL